MATFAYRVKTHDGDVIDATIEAESRQQALALVHQRVSGAIVFLREEDEARRGAGGAPTLPPPAKAKLRGGRIRSRDLTTFFRQMSVSVNAGLPIREALDSILEDLEHTRLRAVLKRVADRVQQGESFSQALGDEPNVFPRLCVALMRTAEEAGTMPATLNDLATTLEKADALSRKIRSILAYPAFVAGFFVVVMLIMTFFILPQFQDIFADAGAKLPTLTRVVFTLNKFMVSHALWELLIVVLLVAAFLLWRRSPSGRNRLDSLMLSMPAFGEVIRMISIARFCKHFAMMVRGGVPIVAGLEIAAEIAGNKVIERALLEVREKLMLGVDMGTSLARHAVFPRLLVRMVSIGEASGRLPDTLEKVAESYESQVEGAIAMATALMEPVIIVFFGAIVLLTVLAVYLPVFSMAGTVQ
jgi:type IV pilus assembly protein PilC